MHVKFGDYHVGDVEFVAAFDVDAKKVGRDLAEAIVASENNTVKICDVPPTGVLVQRGPTHDGLGKYYREMVEESDEPAVDVVAALREARVDVVVSYLPVGSERADKFYAQAAIDAGCGFVNALPVFIASDPEWAQKFTDAGLPIVGDDIKSQVGATIVHRSLARLFEERGVELLRTYQLNFGGNMDFMNMLERERLVSKKISKTQSVTSQIPHEMNAGAVTSARPTTFRGSTTASGPTSGSRAGRSATCRSTPSSSSRCGTRRTRPASSSTPSAPRRSPSTGASAGRSCPRRRTS
jgi:myo-inositol-1-phosphate synthase